MIYDPKTIIGDVIASLYGQAANENELLLRFDNHDNGLLHSALLGTLNTLEHRGLIRRLKNGNMEATTTGIQYIKKHGYLD